MGKLDYITIRYLEKVSMHISHIKKFILSETF